MKNSMASKLFCAATIILACSTAASGSERITKCRLTVHEITAMNGSCFVKITNNGNDIHVEALSAYRFHQAHKAQESLPLSEQKCRGPWINVFREGGEVSAYWGEGCHGGETVKGVEVSPGHFRGVHYEFDLSIK